jgi:hypothetical protein
MFRQPSQFELSHRLLVWASGDHLGMSGDGQGVDQSTNVRMRMMDVVLKDSLSVLNLIPFQLQSRMTVYRIQGNCIEY